MHGLSAVLGKRARCYVYRALGRIAMKVTLPFWRIAQLTSLKNPWDDNDDEILIALRRIEKIGQPGPGRKK